MIALDLSRSEVVASLSRGKKLGICSAILGYEISLNIMKELAEDSDYPLLTQEDMHPPRDVSEGVTLGVYAGLLFDIWHRNWFRLDAEQLDACMGDLTDVLLCSWLELSKDDIATRLEGLEEIFKQDDPMYLNDIGKMMCPGVELFSVHMKASIVFSSHQVHTIPAVLADLAECSDDLLEQRIVQYFSSLGEGE